MIKDVDDREIISFFMVLFEHFTLLLNTMILILI